MIRSKVEGLLRLIVGGAALLAAAQAAALEVNAGDYEAFAPGTNLLVVYAQHADRSKLYSNGQRQSSDANLRSDVGILRVVHVSKLAENVVIDPQFLLPFGRLRAGGDIAALGSASGIGDLILASPIKWVIDASSKDTVSFGPFLHLPTGRYDAADPLNLGENRWKLVTQLAYVRHFTDRWALDLVGDVTFHGRNDDFGPSNLSMKQDPRYELQAHVRYNVSAVTSAMVTLGAVTGGETEVAGVDQGDGLRTTYARVGFAHFFDPTIQLIVQYGRDLKVHSGFKEDDRFNFRFVKVF